MDRHHAAHRRRRPGSDVGALRTRAERAPDGSYRIKGTKIFITYGDHYDMTDNIVHFVLARRCGCAGGHQGHFAVFDSQVSRQRRAARSANATTSIPAASSTSSACTAAPTCTMTMGDKGGAIGYLIGEENRGMLCMFTMMNQALDFGVGLEGDRHRRPAPISRRWPSRRNASRAAPSAARPRVPDAIIVHPDVKLHR